MDTAFCAASTPLTAALLVCAFTPPCAQAQTTPGQIPQPWTYEGSKQIQQQQQQQPLQQYPSSQSSNHLVSPGVVYVCRDERVVVTRCRSDDKSVNSTTREGEDWCSVMYPDRPKRNGFTVQESELRASVVRNLQLCKVE